MKDTIVRDSNAGSGKVRGVEVVKKIRLKAKVED